MRHFFMGLVLFVAGASFGLWIGTAGAARMGDEVEEAEVQRSDLVRGEIAVEALDEPLAPVPGGEHGRTLPVSHALSTVEFDRALLALAARLPAPGGSQSLAGRITDEKGAPIEGATIRVTGPARDRSEVMPTRDPADVGRAYDPTQTIDGLSRYMAESVMAGLTPAGLSFTDANGRFGIDGLADGNYRIQTFAENYVFDPGAAHTGDDVEIVGRSVTTFMLDVVDSDGRAPESATIVIPDTSGRGDHFRWSPDAPFIRIPARVVTLQAFAGELTRSSRGELRAEARSKLATLDYDVNGGGPHRLELEAFPTVVVEITTNSETAESVETWCDLVRGIQRIAVEPTSGTRFLAFDVAPGPYVVEVGRGDGPAEAVREIVVDAGRTEVELELGPVDPKRFIVARCVDTEGRPIQDVWNFGVSYTTDRSSMGSSMSSKARAGGEYWLSLERQLPGSSRHSRASMTSLTLAARSRSRGEVSKEIDPLAQRVDFVFQDPCDLMVKVEGVLRPGLRVDLETMADDGEWRRTVQPEDVPGDGSLMFSALRPGPSRVLLAHESSPRGVHLAEARIDIREGKNVVTLESPEIHDLVILVPDHEDKSFELLVEEGGQYVRAGRADPKGEDRIVFRGLPPGSYRVRYRGRLRHIFADYVVPCGEVVFSPAPVVGYEVISLRDGSPAKQIGLRVGDVLVRVDEIEPSDDSFLLAFTSRVAREEGATIYIERGGSIVEVPARLETPPARPRLGLGATFEPRAQY